MTDSTNAEFAIVQEIFLSIDSFFIGQEKPTLTCFIPSLFQSSVWTFVLGRRH